MGGRVDGAMAGMKGRRARPDQPDFRLKSTPEARWDWFESFEAVFVSLSVG